MKIFYKMLFILLIGFPFTIAAPRQAVDNDGRVCDPVCCDRFYIYDRVKGYCILDLEQLMRGDTGYDGITNNEDDILSSHGNLAETSAKDEMAKLNPTMSKNDPVCDPVCCDGLYQSYNKVKGYCTLDLNLLIKGNDEMKEYIAKEKKHNYKKFQDIMIRRASRTLIINFLIAVIGTVIVCVVIACVYYWKRKDRKSNAQGITVPRQEEEKMAQDCRAVEGESGVQAI